MPPAFSMGVAYPGNAPLKLSKHRKFCKQNNQLPTKNHDELDDNSNNQYNLGPI